MDSEAAIVPENAEKPIVKTENSDKPIFKTENSDEPIVETENTEKPAVETKKIPSLLDLDVQWPFKPNYIVGFRITNNAIFEKIEEFQNDLIASKEVPELFTHVQLHITLNLLELQKVEVPKCVELLQKNFKGEWEIKDDENIVKFQGVGDFFHKALFAKPVAGVPFLKSLFSIIQRILEDGGIKVQKKTEEEYYPHITLFKVKKPNKKDRRRGLESKETVENKEKAVIEIDNDKFADFIFGEQTVSEILLLSMNHEKDKDGFFRQMASFPLTKSA